MAGEEVNDRWQAFMAEYFEGLEGFCRPGKCCSWSRYFSWNEIPPGGHWPVPYPFAPGTGRGQTLSDANLSGKDQTVDTIPFVDSHVHFYDMQHPELVYSHWAPGVVHPKLGTRISKLGERNFLAEDFIETVPAPRT